MTRPTVDQAICNCGSWVPMQDPSENAKVLAEEVVRLRKELAAVSASKEIEWAVFWPSDAYRVAQFEIDTEDKVRKIAEKYRVSDGAGVVFRTVGRSEWRSAS